MITPKVLEQLISSGVVTQLVDIVTIENLPASMANLAHIDTKRYLQYNIPSFNQLLIGLSIPYLTEKKLQLLTSKITKPTELLTIKASQLSLLLTISTAKANEIINYINQPEIIKMLLWYNKLTN